MSDLDTGEDVTHTSECVTALLTPATARTFLTFPGWKEFEADLNTWQNRDTSTQACAGALRTLVQCLRAELDEQWAVIRTNKDATHEHVELKDLKLKFSCVSECLEEPQETSVYQVLQRLCREVAHLEEAHQATLSTASLAEQNRLSILATESAVEELRKESARPQDFGAKLAELQTTCKDLPRRVEVAEQSLTKCQGQLDIVERFQEHMHLAVNELHKMMHDGHGHCHSLVSALQTRFVAVEVKLDMLFPAQPEMEAETGDEPDPRFSFSLTSVDSRDSLGSAVVGKDEGVDVLCSRVSALEEQLAALSCDCEPLTRYADREVSSALRCRVGELESQIALMTTDTAKLFELCRPIAANYEFPSVESAKFDVSRSKELVRPDLHTRKATISEESIETVVPSSDSARSQSMGWMASQQLGDSSEATSAERPDGEGVKHCQWLGESPEDMCSRWRNHWFAELSRLGGKGSFLPQFSVPNGQQQWAKCDMQQGVDASTRGAVEGLLLHLGGNVDPDPGLSMVPVDSSSRVPVDEFSLTEVCNCFVE